MTKLLEDMKRDLEAAIPKKDVQYYFIGRPVSISQIALDRGAIVLEPVSTNVRSVATGPLEEEIHNVRVTVMKSVKDEFVKDSQRESGKQYLTRVIDGRQADGSLQTTSIRYVVRNKMRSWGIIQADLDISYDEPVPEGYPIETVMGIVALNQRNIVNQSLA